MPLIDVPGGASAPALRAHLAIPPVGDGPWPGVVVLHEAFGLTNDIRQQADRLAAAGYLALAPDLYTAGGPWRCVRATFASLMRGQGKAFADIEAARAFLAARGDCTGRVGVIGFCMGGGFALLTAARGFDAAAPNYGHLPKDALEALRGACPIVASYGRRDPSLRGASSTATTPGRSRCSNGSGASATTRSRPRTRGAGSCGSSRPTCAGQVSEAPLEAITSRYQWKDFLRYRSRVPVPSSFRST